MARSLLSTDMREADHSTSDAAASALAADDVQIPPELIQKWQQIVDLIAEIVQVPSSLVMKAEPQHLAVLVASASKGNPYRRGEEAAFDSGVYCEEVMKSRRPLLVPDATADPVWSSNPDLKLGLISYLGYPIAWPSGNLFGTLCVLDVKANSYSELHRRLMTQFLDVIEADLRVLCRYDARLAQEARARLAESERARRVLLGMLEDLNQAQERLQASQVQLQEAVRLRDEQSLTRGIVPPSPEMTLRTFRLAERQIGRLTRLIEELLEVSRIQSGHLALELESLDLVLVARDVVQRFEADLARAGATVTLTDAASVVGFWDRSKLERIVTNLLANAMKFGEGKPIEITVEEVPTGTARLVVTDHGIGIPPERLPCIFERFERAVSAREYGGLGLGLYIVRSLVRGLGGRVWAESQVGRGSTFTVELPCSGPSPGRHVEAEAT